MRSNYKPKNTRTEKPKILYDARGMRVSNPRISNSLKKTLLFYVLPYFVINGLILLLVTARPKIEISVADTNDYRTTEVSFTVKSLLPLKSLKADIESQEIALTQEGSVYKASVNMNGTFYVEAESFNGMQASNYADISVLDATSPQVNPDNCEITGGNLRFVITDSQSGVNFDSIYGIYDGTKEVRPISIDKESGTVVIPLFTNSIEIHAEDMVGNAMSGKISASTDYKGELSDAAEGGSVSVEDDGAAGEEE